MREIDDFKYFQVQDETRARHTVFHENRGRWCTEVMMFMHSLEGKTFGDCERLIGDRLQELEQLARRSEPAQIGARQEVSNGGVEVLATALQKMEADLGKIRTAIGTNAMNLILGIRSEPLPAAPYGVARVRK